MRKTIAVLVVLLLAVSSAQAVTVLMDENFDSANQWVDIDTLALLGWTNNHGSGVLQIRTTYPDIEAVDVGRGIFKYGYEDDLEETLFTSFYEYEIDDSVALGAGQYYRYESFWHVTDGPTSQDANAVTRLRHTDGRLIQWAFDAGEVTWQDGYLDLSIWTSAAGTEIKSINLPLSNNPMVDLRVRIDVDAAGVTVWYNPGEAPGSGWVLFGQALASEDSRFGFTGGLEAVEVELYNVTALDRPQADTFSLIVDGAPGIPGDFDLDNDVDGVDFGKWQTGYPMASGATLGDGDADGDGDVDGVDFGIWQENYPTNLGGSATIPEPATLAVLALAGFAVLLRRKR